MKLKAIDWPNGKRKYEIPCVNGQLHGLAKWWHSNGQKEGEITYVNGQIHGLEKWWHENGKSIHEIPFTNGQRHGLEKWWHDDGSLYTVEKWHQDQSVWGILFPSEERILEDEEIELFFHPTPELT